ncbi:hypothetical protein SDC9_66802 [bioreactor metagenome]|uniref:Hemerythrin-like domain-containing protein n=1 Tax=bioreactor metagenome TaxID=1076179 RepID=A0A644Y1G6_9ZZZZ
MHQHWRHVVRRALLALADGEQQAFTAAQEIDFDVFQQRYERHLKMEDELAYPAARQVVGDAEQRSMGEEMAARRRTSPTRPA